VVNRKLLAALRNGLNAILAVGETKEERQAGQTDEILEHQLGESLAGVGPEDMSRVVIAYEPVWAIGTGETATPEQAREAHAFVRDMLGRIYGPEMARDTRIQYGGSVTAQNAATLLSQPGVDGALVGGASLKPDDFTAIVQAAG
jgi:triosephosphate isomerase